MIISHVGGNAASVVLGGATLAEVEDAMAKELGEEIQKILDQRILFDLMKYLGWTHIIVTADKNPEEIKQWCKNNCSGEYRGIYYDWIFENPRDAVLFTLRWS